MHPWFNLFIYVVWFLSTYFMVFFILSVLVHRKEVFQRKKANMGKPPVTFIIPAFNEEKDIAATIRSLKRVTYNNAEFVIVNDGSSDRTSSIVNKCIRGDTRFTFIDNEKNQGKSLSLNQGIDSAKGEFVACMDADSIVEKNIIEKVLPYFEDPDVGATTVSVEVNNPKNFLNKVIELEFTIGLSLFLKIFSFFDCVFVTPGPFSMYRKKMLQDIGGFDPENITEDYEIAFRIHKAGYKIKNCIEAKVYTNLPEDFRGTYIQRRRWYSGSIQTIFQHKDMWFNPKYGLFGFFIPYNFLLIFLGIGVFLGSSYLGISRFIRESWYYSYTGFNFFEHIELWNFDILRFGTVNVLALTMISATIILMLIGLHYTRKRYRTRKLGMLGYPLLFFLYQIFWGGAIWAVIRGRKIKWR